MRTITIQLREIPDGWLGFAQVPVSESDVVALGTKAPRVEDAQLAITRAILDLLNPSRLVPQPPNFKVWPAD
jgi:hypothetical protein